MTLNDAILAATGGPTVNDGLRAWYIANGAVSGALPDLERQFLLANGGVSGSNQDMWMQILSAAGYTGTLNDMLYQFWLAGGVIGFDPADMFTPTTPGWVYDLSDFSTLFQNSAGTTPVTAVEQPVGLVLDKSQGLVLGPELVTALGPSGATITTNTPPSTATCTSSGHYGFLAAIAVTGKVCTVTISWSGNTAGRQITADIGNSYGNIIGTSVSGSRTFQAASSTGATSAVYAMSGLVGESFTLESFSVKAKAGNHASQPTTTKRPVLSSRVNLIAYSENLALWNKRGTCTVTANATTAPDGTVSAALVGGIGASANDCYTQTSAGPTPAVEAALTAAFWLKRVSTSGVLRVNNAVSPARGDFNIDLSMLSNSWEYITAGHPAVTVAFPYTSGGINNGYQIQSISGAPLSVYAWGFDMRIPSSTIPAYQKSNTATDYDTEGFPLYLKGDGVDDFMSTAAIAFTGTDAVTGWYGVQKLSDASNYGLFELSTGVATNAGAFLWTAGNDGLLGYHAIAAGSSVGGWARATPYSAPDKAVLVATHDISTSLSTLERNGVAGTPSSASMGTGNFGNYPAYLLARDGGTGAFFNGQLYSSVCLGRVATDEELDSTRDWVNDRTGAYTPPHSFIISPTSYPKQLYYVTTVTLPDGRILAAGGSDELNVKTKDVYLGTVSGDSISWVATTPSPETEAWGATTLQDGRAYFGFWRNSYFASVSGNVITWTPATNTPGYGQNMIQLPDGRLVSYNYGLSVGTITGNSIAWVTSAGPTSPAVDQGSVQRLPDGRVLVWGGYNPNNPSSAAYICTIEADSTATFIRTNDYPISIIEQGSFVLDGGVYSYGGFTSDSWVPTNAIYKAEVSGNATQWLRQKDAPSVIGYIGSSVCLAGGQVVITGGQDKEYPASPMITDKIQIGVPMPLN